MLANESKRCQACGQFHQPQANGLCPLNKAVRNEKKWLKWRAHKGHWQIFIWNAEKHKKVYLNYAGAYNLGKKWAALLVKASIEPGAHVYLGMEKMPER